MSATDSRTWFCERVTSGSARARMPPLRPAMATPRPATASPGIVMPVKYRKANPSAHDTSAGTNPARAPR